MQQPRGAYKIASRNRALELYDDPAARSARRVQRILRSLRAQIVEGGFERIRIRRVIKDPREIYRLELELPDISGQRTTLLDRAALEQLLEADEVRALVRTTALHG